MTWSMTPGGNKASNCLARQPLRLYDSVQEPLVGTRSGEPIGKRGATQNVCRRMPTAPRCCRSLQFVHHRSARITVCWFEQTSTSRVFACNHSVATDPILRSSGFEKAQATFRARLWRGRRRQVANAASSSNVCTSPANTINIRVDLAVTTARDRSNSRMRHSSSGEMSPIHCEG